MPDLVSHCTFKLRINRHRKQITSETKKWLFQGDNLVGKARDKYHGLKAGLLTSMCYPDAAAPQLRVCNDYLTYLFHLDNLSDDMDNYGTTTTADAVLNSLYHPYTYRCPARVGRMTRECVIPRPRAVNPTDNMCATAATTSGCCPPRRPAASSASSRRSTSSSRASRSRR